MGAARLRSQLSETVTGCLKNKMYPQKSSEKDMKESAMSFLFTRNILICVALLVLCTMYCAQTLVIGCWNDDDDVSVHTFYDIPALAPDSTYLTLSRPVSTKCTNRDSLRPLLVPIGANP